MCAALYVDHRRQLTGTALREVCGGALRELTALVRKEAAARYAAAVHGDHQDKIPSERCDKLARQLTEHIAGASAAD